MSSHEDARGKPRGRRPRRAGRANSDAERRALARANALLAGLRHAYELGLERVDARSDCRLLVSHLSGERIPVNPKLVALGDEILELTTRIGSVTISWTPSDANGVAHALVSDALARRTDSIARRSV